MKISWGPINSPREFHPFFVTELILCERSTIRLAVRGKITLRSCSFLNCVSFWFMGAHLQFLASALVFLSPVWELRQWIFFNLLLWWYCRSHGSIINNYNAECLSSQGTTEYRITKQIWHFGKTICFEKQVWGVELNFRIYMSPDPTIHLNLLATLSTTRHYLMKCDACIFRLFVILLDLIKKASPQIPQKYREELYNIHLEILSNGNSDVQQAAVNYITKNRKMSPYK